MQAITFVSPVESDWSQIASIILSWVQKIVYFFAPILIAYAGILFIASEGEPQKVSQAKKLIFWVALAVGIAVSANEIVQKLEDAFLRAVI